MSKNTNGHLPYLGGEICDAQARILFALTFMWELSEKYDYAMLADRKPNAELLLVDDSRQYARLVREAFREINAHVSFHMASDGIEALTFLRHPGMLNPR